MIRVFPALLLACITLAACASPPPDAQRGPKRTLSPPPSAPLPRATTAQKVVARLDAGDPLGALMLVRAEIGRGVRELALGDSLVASLNEALAEAQRMSARGEFDRAGHAYRQVQEGFPRTPSLAARIAVSSEEVQERIASCSERLMAEGLRAYRQGSLEGAVETWSRILEFDPNNVAALRAIETASRQLQKLRTLD